MKKKKRDSKEDSKESGFTMVETLLVLAVSALLLAGAGVSTNRVVENARVNQARQQISQYKSALQSYYVDCGKFPSSQQGLEALWEKPVIAPIPANWDGPYLDRAVQRDPWGNSYLYLQRTTASYPDEAPDGLPFVILSLGADGAKGGTGKDADVQSWD